LATQTPNGIGTILGIVQLALYCYYHRNSIEEETKEPLIVSYVWGSRKEANL